MALTVLDAGVIIGVLDADDAHHAAAGAALAESMERGDVIAVPASAYADCLVEPARRGIETVEAIDAFLFDLAAEVEPITRQVARRAAELRARHGTRLRLPDALVVALALHLGAERVLATDRGWPHLGVRVEVLA